jgi:hypothetical protein
VREDADVADAVAHLMIAKLRNNGESCIAVNTVFVPTSLSEEFRSVLAARIEATRPGPQSEAEADFGPLIDMGAVERLTALVDKAEQAGKRVVRGQSGPDGGAFTAAAVVEDARGTELYDQEIFGPVLALVTYDDEDAVVKEVNAWGVGLAGYVCGRDIAAAQDLAERLRVGIVGVNNGAPTPRRSPSAASVPPESAVRGAWTGTTSSPSCRPSRSHAERSLPRKETAMDKVVLRTKRDVIAFVNDHSTGSSRGKLIALIALGSIFIDAYDFTSLAIGLDSMKAELSLVAEFTRNRDKGKFVNFWQPMWYAATITSAALVLPLVFLGMDQYMWRWAVGFGAVPALIILALRFFFADESPMWAATTSAWTRR